ncbi:MAG TPA: U32 family peptidase [Azospirillum sp.]|nr:U32 family peptidase [Azospirillum sp.]
MKIVAPVSRPEDVAPLAEAGADEFYCGIVPRDWTERFRSSGVNRRIFGNLSTYEELAAVADQAHARGCTVSLVLNAQHYAEEHMAALLELSERFAGLGGDALIVGDVGLLALLADEGPRLRLHASSLLSCRNSEAASLYAALGVRRVVFPRDVTLAEMADVIAANPGIEFEAFVLNDGCVFEEGTCHTIHLPGRLGGPICLDRYASAYARSDDRALSEDEAAALAANDARYEEWLWYRFSCGFSTTESGHPFGPCGLCAMPAMAEAGMTAVKIAGREGPLPRKLKSVEMVRSVRDAMADGDAVEFARGIRNRPDLCDSGYMCYYREVLSPGTVALPADRPDCPTTVRSI